MTVEQRAELEASIAEAERGQVVAAEQVFGDLARKLDISRT